ncbi:tripartite tricarboxylate transporter substrate binding protein [Alcaligenaceae bacterium]|nr:tripartite tricarboxylate transporter substrate binding protein [Alcaligenaceae bacterium]
MKILIKALILSSVFFFTGPTVAAESFPSKPVHVIVPYQSGGGLDMMCRVIAAQLEKQLGQSFVVENRTGAAGTIGTRMVVRSEPDGHTILCGNNSEITLAPFMMQDIGYDPQRDLVPITMAVKQTLILIAHPSLEAKNLAQLIELAKKSPLSYGTSGKGSSLHLPMLMLAHVANAPFVDVPYRGAAGLITDLLAGHIPLAVVNLAPIADHISSNRLRPIAVFTETRNPSLPDVQTVKETLGVEVPAYSWFGLLAPANIPKDRLEILDENIRKALSQDSVRSALERVHMEVVAMPSEAFKQAVEQEREFYAKLTARFDLKAQ